MLVLKCMRNTAKQLKRSQPIPSPPHHRGSRCINMGTLGVRTHTWSTNSKWPVTISERGKWKRCEINSIWLPRQVNDNTYHCIHGDLSAGRKAKKKKERKESLCVLLAFRLHRHFSQGATPFEWCSGHAFVPCRSIKDVRWCQISRGLEGWYAVCCRGKAGPWWESRMHVSARHTR